MKSFRILAPALALILILSSSIAHAGVRDDRPNLIGGEILGRGLFVTLNYERYFTNTLGVGGGLMAIGTGDGSAVIVPLYFSVVPGNVHSFYGSAGVTWIAGGGDVNDWEETTVLTVSAGYQYQSAGGFFVRPLFTYLVPSESGSGDEFLLWPGITIGGSF